MEILKILALVCLAVAGASVLIAKLDPGNRKKAPRILRVSEAGNKYEEEDRRFEAKLFGSLGPDIVNHFYTKVVGITQENENGTVRETLLSRTAGIKPAMFFKNALTLLLADRYK